MVQQGPLDAIPEDCLFGRCFACDYDIDFLTCEVFILEAILVSISVKLDTVSQLAVHFHIIVDS